MSTQYGLSGFPRQSRAILSATVTVAMAMLIGSTAWAQSPTRPQRPGSPKISTNTTGSNRIRRPGQPSTATGPARPGQPGAATKTTRPGTATGAATSTGRPGTATSSTATGTTATPGKSGSIVVRRGAGGQAFNTSGSQGAWEPYRQHPIDWKEVPDEGKQILSLDARGMSVNDFMETLALTMGWTIMMSDDVASRTLNVYFNNISIRDALKSLRMIGLYYEYDKASNIFHVMTQDEYYVNKYGKLERAEYTINHIDVTDMQSIVETVMSPLGRILVDQRQAKLIVYDTADNQKDIKELIEDLDVKIEPVVLPVTHINAEDAASAVTELLSVRGSIEINMQNNEMIISDIPEAVKRIRDRVKLLDIAIEPTVIPVKYINVEDASSAVTQLLSARGYVETNLPNNELIVSDIPEAVRRIKERVALIDTEIEPITIQIKYLRADEVADTVSALLSARGYIEPDMRTNQLIVSDIPEALKRIRDRVTLIDVEMVTKTFDIKHALLEDVQDALTEIVPEESGTVAVDARMRRITVTSTPDKVAEVAETIDRLDQKSRQVHIKAYVIRADANLIRDLGIEWSQVVNVANSDDFYKFTVAPSISQTSNVLEYTNPNSIGGAWFRGSLNFLLSDANTKVLSEPEISVIDGERASFRVQTEVPFLSGTSVQYSSGGQPQGADITDYYRYFPQQVMYKNVGILLDVLPKINIAGDIDLEINIEDSNFTNVQLPGVGNVPSVTVSSAQTKMVVQSQSTVVIGGLKSGRADDSVDKLPVLGDIPLIGGLFKTTHKKDNNQELIIFLTPTATNIGATSPKVETLDTFRQDMQDNRQNMKEWPFGKFKEQKQVEPASRGETAPKPPAK
ncbi:MAG: hypothetical protein J7M12_06455 [Candidatus Hydrogenedentes bacterium]|nr:hypothetical protein [Candidatus Hydrogenedentota bacterium]